MKTIQQKQDAINILFNKKEKQLLELLRNLQLTKSNHLYKLNLITQKLNHIQTVHVGQVTNIIFLQNNSNLSNYLIDAKESIQIEINKTDIETKEKQDELAILLNKKKALDNYFNNLKKQKQFILDKKEEARLQDQFTAFKRISKLNEYEI